MSTRITGHCTDCGYSGTYTSEAMARAALRRHSCATHRERQARAERRQQRLANPGPTRDCTHAIFHPHGSTNAYKQDRCRCLDCRRANRTTQAARERAALYGRPSHDLVDAEPARRHVRSLMKQSMGLKRIAAAVGVNTSTLAAVIYPRRGTHARPIRNRISKDSSAKIVSVTLDPAGRTSLIASTRSCRGTVITGNCAARSSAR